MLSQYIFGYLSRQPTGSISLKDMAVSEEYSSVLASSNDMEQAVNGIPMVGAECITSEQARALEHKLNGPADGGPEAIEVVEIESLETSDLDGVLIGYPVSLQSKICCSRNFFLAFVLVLLVSVIVGTDVLATKEDENVATPWNQPYYNDEYGDLIHQDGEGVIEDDDIVNENDGENNNVVDYDEYNPKRDGVEFISPECNYTCRTDRLPHETPLYPGQVLCNEMYRFGLTEEDNLVLQDCKMNSISVIWNSEAAELTPDQYPIHFELQKNGNFQIISDSTGEVLLDEPPKDSVTFHPMCLLDNPKLDCPYLHLHPDGVTVLNWIDDYHHKWMVKNMMHQYLGLFGGSED